MQMTGTPRSFNPFHTQTDRDQFPVLHGLPLHLNRLTNRLSARCCLPLGSNLALIINNAD